MCTSNFSMWTLFLPLNSPIFASCLVVLFSEWRSVFNPWPNWLKRQTSRLGRLLGRPISAIEEFLHADRLYCLSFCEILRDLHFHLLPRTSALLSGYGNANGRKDEAVNGALLFEWTRETYPNGSILPENLCSELDNPDQIRNCINS